MAGERYAIFPEASISHTHAAVDSNKRGSVPARARRGEPAAVGRDGELKADQALRKKWLGPVRNGVGPSPARLLKIV